MHPVSPRACAQKSRPRTIILVCGAGAALFPAGCASQFGRAAASAAAHEKIVLTEDQYEYVYVTGSTIPVRVPKEAIARPVPQTAFPVVIADPEAFQRMSQRAQAGGR